MTDRGVLDQPLGCAGIAVEEDILDPREQLRLDVLVHRKLACIHDAEVEPRADGVVEKGGVHGLAHRVVPAEGKGQVRDPARHERSRAALLEQRNRIDERLREGRMLLDPCRDGEDVRVEHDVLWEKCGVSSQQVVRAAEDLDLALDRIGLASLVECHHDDRRAVAAHGSRLLEKCVLAFLQRDRVHDALPLDALETGLERREARAVHHDRDPRDLGLGRDEVQERGHGLLGVEQVRVHVHVEQVGATAHLLQRDVDGALEVAGFDQRPEACGARDVRTLADDDEAGVRVDDEGLEAGEPRAPERLRHAPRRQAGDSQSELSRVLGSRATAAANEIDEAVLGECAEIAARIPRLLVVEAELVREPRVRVAGGVRRCHLGQALDERPHLGRAERAVHTDDEWLGVLHGEPERLDRLAGEVPARAIDCRERDPER